ncbi:MAG: exosortase/archaeosortase family protein [Rariglobus sp.]
MSDPLSDPQPPAPALRWDAGRITALFLVICTVIAFWPVTRWMVQEVSASQQIRQAFVLLGAAAGLVAWQHASEWRLKLETGNRALILLGGAYVFTALAWWLKIPLLVLPAFALGLAGVLHVVVGVEAWRFVKPLFAGFVACLVIILLFPMFDWPLRQMAGVNAARLLQHMGFTPELSVILEPTPKLILATGRNFFEVATECNGFGLITSGAVLALLAGGIAGRRVLALLWLVPVAMLIGFTFNLLRILAICVLAPSFPNHYHLLHETAGIIMLWSGLGLIGWLAWRPAANPPATPTTTAGNTAPVR